MNMSAKWKVRIGVKIAKLKLRTWKRKQVCVNRAVGSARIIMICLPFGIEEARRAYRVARDLSDSLSLASMVILGRRSEVEFLPEDASLERSVLYLEDDLGFFLLPKGDLRQKVGLENVDISLDFHRDFCLTTAYLCAASRADVKVGFKSQSSSAFFNVEYVPKYNGKGTEEIYRDLAEVIYLMCAGEAER